MTAPLRLILPALATTLVLAACGGGKDGRDRDDDDPAVSGALGDQIMVDPELAGQDGSRSGLAANRAGASLPPEDRTPEAIAAAKAAAARIAGGSISRAPDPATGADTGAGAAVTPAQLAAAQGMGSNCADKAEYSTAWAARLPAALTVYPRGHVVEAAGTDRDGCRLRVVNFVTPVALGDVIDFYYTRARAAGFDAEHRIEGRDHVLGGSKDTAAYVIYARKLRNGLSEVDIVANGG